MTGHRIALAMVARQLTLAGALARLIEVSRRAGSRGQALTAQRRSCRHRLGYAAAAEEPGEGAPEAAQELDGVVRIMSIMLNNNSAATVHMKRRPLNLTPAGPDWDGWTFGPYGRACSFRLVTPNGEALTAREVADLRHTARDCSYLVSRNRALEAELRQIQEWFSRDEVERIRAAFAIIEAILPRDSSSLPRPFV